jgi:hypothetical protein
MVLESFNCEIYAWGTEETVEHLFWHCSFAQQCWGILNLQTVLNGNSIEKLAAIKKIRLFFSMDTYQACLPKGEGKPF